MSCLQVVAHPGEFAVSGVGGANNFFQDGNVRFAGFRNSTYITGMYFESVIVCHLQSDIYYLFSFASVLENC